MANLENLRYSSISPEGLLFHPKVTLISTSQTTIPHYHFDSPEKLANINSLRVVSAAAAQTCYSQLPHTPLMYVTEAQPYQENADKIAKSVFEAGHHSTLEHLTYSFSIEDVSRLITWSVLHRYPFYDTDQQSQRYVEMRATSTIPFDCGNPELNQLAYDTTVRLFAAYHQLNQIIRPTIKAAYFERYKKINPSAIDKQTQEISRYVLPQLTSTNLIYTINAPTLLRLHYLQDTFVPEAKVLIQSMVEAVCQYDPSFKQYLQEPINHDQTPESIIRRQHNLHYTPFQYQQLPPWYPNSLVNFDIQDLKSIVPKTGKAVRQKLNYSPDQLPDTQAIAQVLDPRYNVFLTSNLAPEVIDPFSQSLRQARTEFDTVLSLSADAQFQRHRTMDQNRPIQIPIPTQDTHFYIPQIVQENPEALKLYLETCQLAAQTMQKLIDSGIPQSQVQYLAPNATLIETQVSAPILGLHHFLKQRTCFRAQIEVHEIAISIAKRLQLDPILSQYFDHITPCAIRRQANIKPFCLENPRQWCGVENWKNTLVTLPHRRI